MGKNPDMSGTFLVLTILGIALVESAAIYALIIAMQIVNIDPASGIEASRAIGA
jgi:F0F1-type ATP synthase membrane subunit c/vacuolar-type H+-ATPase subunit K